MAKSQKTPLVAAPTAVAAGETSDDILRNIRVIDADTGEEILRVVNADSVAGTVERFLIEDGNLVRKDDAFVTVTEKRKLRIEWIEPLEAPSDAETPPKGDPAAEDEGKG